MTFENLTLEKQGVLYEHLAYLGVGVIWALVVGVIAKKIDFYRLYEKRVKALPIHFSRNALGAFVVFFLIELILPLSVGLYAYWNGINDLGLKTKGLTAIGTIFTAAAGVFLYCAFLPSKTRRVLLGPEIENGMQQNVKDFFFGCLTWFFSYPILVIVSQVVAIFVLLLTDQKQFEQKIVEHLMSLNSYPVLLGVTILGVITVVPIVEEILFRGFLQSWLTEKTGRVRAIFITSIIFSAFHFAFSQGISNIELLFSLFILSCYLGFIYEKKRSILAPIGLHAFFNLEAISLLFL